MAKKDNKGDKKLGWRIGSAIIILLFGLFVWGVVSFFWTGDTKDIEATANQFKPRQDWTLAQEQVEGPKSFCGDVSCPSVRKTWNLPEPLSKQVFETIIKESGWTLQFEDSCFTAKDISKDACWAKGSSNGYKILLTANNKDILTSKPSVRLTVEK